MKQTKLWIGFLGICLMAAAAREASAAITIQDGIPWVYEGTGNGGASILHGPGRGNVTIPSDLDGYPVTSIGNRAFYGCGGLTSITIPVGVTNIGDDTFTGCNGLTSVTIPDGVTSIGNAAFSDCSGLTSITIPDRVTNIGNATFAGCNGLTSVTIPYRVTSIGNAAFSDCSGLTSVTIPNGVTNIGDSAFYCCNSLTNITIPDRVTNIGDDTFAGCSGLTSVTIPDSVTNIGWYAFSSCSGLASVTIPDSVRSIGWLAFAYCSGLKTLYAPESWKTKYVDWIFWSGYAGVPEDCEIVYGAPPEAPTTRTGVPYTWLEEHGLGDGTEEGYEAAATADAANNAYTVADCYVAGLDPSDPSATFTADIAFTNGAPVVSWTPDLNEEGAKSERSYEVEGRATMTNEWGATNAASRFFRVKVGLP